MSVKIKICGLMREADADAVNAVMPDYAGFVFYEKSRRCLTAERARAIRSRLDPEIKAVGVFVNMPCEKIAELAGSVPLDIAQLHGGEIAEDIEKLKKLCPDLEIWKAARVGEGFDPKSLEKYKNADRLLLDAYVDVSSGAETDGQKDAEKIKEIVNIIRSIK